MRRGVPVTGRVFVRVGGYRPRRAAWRVALCGPVRICGSGDLRFEALVSRAIERGGFGVDVLSVRRRGVRRFARVDRFGFE